MANIELEFDSKLNSTQELLEKISQIVKYAEEQGLHLRELESLISNDLVVMSFVNGFSVFKYGSHFK